MWAGGGNTTLTIRWTMSGMPLPFADEIISAPEIPSTAPPTTNILLCTPYKLKLVELFDYTNSFWLDAAEKWGIRSLEEVLEAYNLVDLDAEGEDDLKELQSCI